MMRTEKRTRVPARAGLAIAALTAGVVTLASCGSSGTSTSGSTTGSTTSPSGTSSSAPSSTSAPAGSTAASGPVATASAFAAKYLNPPAALGVTAPLPAAPPHGKTVAFLQCEVQQCNDLGSGVRAGAAAVGWKTTTIPWKSVDPATLVSGLQRALKLSPKPEAVIFSGLPSAVWSSQVGAFKKAGIPLIASVLGPATIDGTVIANLLDPTDVALQGKILADWFISDSNGKGKVLQQDIPDFPTIGEVGSGFRAEVAASCPACTVTKLDVTGAQVATGGVTPAIVSALQRDKSIGYVAASDIALAPGLPAALKAAGLGKVKIIGGAADATTEQMLRGGTGSAFMKNDLAYVGWLAVDVALRHQAGVKFTPNDGGVPQRLLTKDTVGAAGSSGEFPPGYPNLFKKLWKVG